VVRGGPDAVRLIRISAAQRRVAELVSKRWAVPVGAKAELDAALRVLVATSSCTATPMQARPCPANRGCAHSSAPPMACSCAVAHPGALPTAAGAAGRA
jgi:hypothetical protein